MIHDYQIDFIIAALLMIVSALHQKDKFFEALLLIVAGGWMAVGINGIISIN